MNRYEQEEITFIRLLDDWVQEEFHGAIELKAWHLEGKYPTIPEHGIWLKIPVAGNSYANPCRIIHQCVGSVKGLDVSLHTLAFQPVVSSIDVVKETKNAADPDLFPWMARTIRSANYSDAKKAGLIEQHTTIRRPH